MAGMDVLGISRSQSSINGIYTDEYNCDILDKTRLKEILSSYKPNYIVHLAGPAFIPNSLNHIKQTYDIIFDGTLNLFESITELGLSSKILYVSSADVYGSGEGRCLSETDPYDPLNPYSSAKACAELLCRQFYNTHGLDCVIARPFNHTGPGQSVDFVCSSFAYQVASMRIGEHDVNKLYTGNIDVKRDFLDVRDVVEAYYRLLMLGKPGEVYNICSGIATSLRDIIQSLFRVAGIEKYDIINDPIKTRKDDIPIRLGDNQKLKTLTAWEPCYSIETTVKDIFEYWKENIHVE
jgi:GDP-4-dehydro-6-deoxy-D-mannose reductase